jgi:hypothetical protein
MWISNSPFADLAIVWAKAENTEGRIHGLIVERGMEGFTTPTTHGKLSLRASPTGELVFDNVKVPVENLIGEEGKGILHGAAKAFARLDPDPIALTKRYGEIMDPEHEYSFYGGVVPALLANLGWTEATLEFGIWLLRMNYYNSISHESFWNKHGFGAAAERFFPDPKAFAAHFLARYQHYGFEPAETSETYPIYFIDVLDREVTRKSPWTQALFEAWKLMPRAE